MANYDIQHRIPGRPGYVSTTVQANDYLEARGRAEQLYGRPIAILTRPTLAQSSKSITASAGPSGAQKGRSGL